MISLERASHPARSLGVWHLPVVNEYLQQLESDFPDAWHLLYTIHDRIWAVPRSDRSKSNASIQDEISYLASILKSNPRLFLGCNVLMRDRGFSVQCPHDAAEVEYFVFITPSGSTILSTIEGKTSSSESLMHLRATLFTSDHPFDKIIADNPSVSWMTCIAELLQVELDSRRPMTSSYRRKIFHCLRMLAKRSIIPPSLFLSNIIRTEGHPLSWGGFANIHQGKIGDVTVCLKVLRMFDLSPDARKTSTSYKEFASEALIWRQLDHPNILPMLGASDEIYAPFLCLVSPYMQNGNIMSFLKQHPEHDRFTSILEVVAGITYLHALDPPITHKDIKGANILVKDDGRCCLADFGLSSAYGSQQLTTTSHFKGSVRWLAPELIAPGRFPNHIAGLPGDIYALACTIYEIYTGKPPLSHLATDVAVIQAVILENKRESLPPTPSSMWDNRERRLWLLVDECWHTSPSERPDITFISKILMEIRDSQHGEDIQDGPTDVSISESANSDQPMLGIHEQRAHSSTSVGHAKSLLAGFNCGAIASWPKRFKSSR
ncbi:kinase-like domain-containing protein [Crucibulum laeve]|uniref:Kinase-like domain-containing protein n=1 Tax=Crucibulum laeve TaxID=68775 RepID=A0A5C3M1X5_9AGAR|nr:kinase-like domain-containing protein [Crucibulum laeve]